MMLPELSPEQFLYGLTLAGLLLLLFTFIPVQLVSKWRRTKRSYNRLTCRICGYRFLRRAPGIVKCPHCGARNGG